MSDEVIAPYPNLQVPELAFQLLNPALAHVHPTVSTQLVDLIKQDEMGAYYKSLYDTPANAGVGGGGIGSPRLGRRELEGGLLGRKDEALLKELEEKNEKTLSELDLKIQEAEKVDGESEIAEALRNKASYLTRIGEKERAIEAQKKAFEKNLGVGSRIDISLTLVRIGLFFSLPELVKEYVTKAEELIEKGGDWDRRNRLKVYTAYSTLQNDRSFTTASNLLVDSLPTFTATELLPLQSYIQLTILLASFSLSRTALRSTLKSAEVSAFYVGVGGGTVLSRATSVPTPTTPLSGGLGLGGVRELQNNEVGDLAQALVDSDYSKFFQSLAAVEENVLANSRLMSRHKRYYVREMKVKAYRQLLESYQSLTIESMARAFGVSTEFVDNDLLRFVSTGRLNCIVDRVHGIVETNRPSNKSAKFESVVKQGDILLNEVQRLSKVLY